jgi:hypothetical protein
LNPTHHRNHSSTTVVHGQTFLEWFRDSYIFDYQGISPLVSGMYFDDYWPEKGGFPDPFKVLVTIIIIIIIIDASDPFKVLIVP